MKFILKVSLRRSCWWWWSHTWWHISHSRRHHTGRWWPHSWWRSHTWGWSSKWWSLARSRRSHGHHIHARRTDSSTRSRQSCRRLLSKRRNLNRSTHRLRTSRSTLRTLSNPPCRLGRRSFSAHGDYVLSSQ